MKLALRILQHKRQRGNAPQAAKPKGSSWALLLGITAITAAATFALFEYVILSKIPVTLLGKWVVVTHDADREAVGMTMEFFRDASVITRMGGGEDVPGAAKVRNDKLFISIPNRNSRTGEHATLAYLLIEMSPTQLLLEDESGSGMKLERVN
jgi:hypothetical protein